MHWIRSMQITMAMLAERSKQPLHADGSHWTYHVVSANLLIESHFSRPDREMPAPTRGRTICEPGGGIIQLHHVFFIVSGYAEYGGLASALVGILRATNHQRTVGVTKPVTIL